MNRTSMYGKFDTQKGAIATGTSKTVATEYYNIHNIYLCTYTINANYYNLIGDSIELFMDAFLCGKYLGIVVKKYILSETHLLI